MDRRSETTDQGDPRGCDAPDTTPACENSSPLNRSGKVLKLDKGIGEAVAVIQGRITAGAPAIPR